MNRIMFDKFGTCKKCGGGVQRLKTTKTWHHVEQSDYLRCGFVELEKGEEDG